jgi:hypothetical protein
MARLRVCASLRLVGGVMLGPVGNCRAQIVQDSAGIHLVKYPAAAKPPAVWTIDPTPVLQLGGHAQRDAEEFSRVVGVVRLSDGTVVVANGGSNELRYFNATGTFLAKAGRTGEGPGEFRQLSRLFLLGDTVIATDAMGVATRFSARGTRLGTIARPKNLTGLPQLVGVFRDGSAAYLISHPFDQGARTGVVAIYTSVIVVGKSGDTKPLLDHMLTTTEVGSAYGARPQVFAAFRLFSASQSGICSAYGDAFAVSCVDFDGRRAVRIAWDRPTIPITTEMQSIFRRGIAGHHSQSEGGREVAVEPIFAKTMPFLADLRRTAEDELWVQNYSMDRALLSTGRFVAPNDPTDWTVFSADGRMLASVRLPARFQPFQMGRDWVLGVMRDNDDVELVTLLHVRRGV